MTRLRDLGIVIGTLGPGPRNSITDVDGVTVGHATVVHDEPQIARTGVTVIRPRPGSVRDEPLHAGASTLNGNGEMTGLEWIRESGLLTTTIGLTGTHSVGIVRDELAALDTDHPDVRRFWSMPVVGETSDRALNDGNAQFVTREHVRSAFAAASVDVAEGSVGGGTGMTSHGFKSGIGTASRRLAAEDGGWTVGVLVQSNYGTRADLRVDGRPVGRSALFSDIALPGPKTGQEPDLPPGSGSIIVVVATDAPLLPGSCRRLAARAGLGIARMGGGIQDASGDIFLAFSTAPTGLPLEGYGLPVPATVEQRTVPHQRLDELFRAVVESTEEAILNSMLASPSMTGARGHRVEALPAPLLRAAYDETR